ncbi:MAG: carboxylesterase family protein [Bacteroidia bacterium]|nr:carboxylesterase family protein [Bacteroidia bacterium]
MSFKYKYYISILFICFPILLQAQQTVIQTDKGKIQGKFNAQSKVRIFKGIPFAAPPLGNLRWKAPQAVDEWEGILACTDFSPSPIQNEPKPFYCWSEEFIAQPEPLSEDCLYLNVWTSAKSNKEKQAVFVWIYGGGLNSGSANCDIYDGEEMAKKGVIFVSLNYRVGVLGFMAHPELSKESVYQASGNYGFLDQMAALRWIQENISAFGGDPDNVTIAGQSAGAFSVNALIASPLAKGLFHKAILQSGGLLSSRLKQGLTEVEQMGMRFMKKAEANSLEDLRKLPADKLQKISNDREIGRFGVTLDGYVLPKNLLSHFEKSLHQQVPIMAGWVTGDGDFLGRTEMSVAAYREQAQKTYGENADAFLHIFSATTNEEVKVANSKLAMLNFAGLPSHLLAGFNTKPTYLYQFGHVPPDKPDFPNYGAFHTSEVPYALHTLHTWKRPWKPLDRKLEEVMSSYWVNFTKTGNPNGAGLPVWEIYEKESGTILTLENETKSQKALLKEALDFLEKKVLQNEDRK